MSTDADETTTEEAGEPEPKAGLFTRLRRRPVRTGVVFGAIVALIGGGIFLSTWLTGSKEPAPTIDELVRLLEQGDYDELRRRATQLASLSEATHDDRGAASYVIGRALVHEAENETTDARRKAKFMIAARYFQEAAANGFPEGHRVQGDFHLGWSLLESGLATQALPAFLDVLESQQDAELQPTLVRQSLANLIEIHLNDPNLSLARGFEYSEYLLSREDLTDDERSSAVLLQADVMTAQMRFDDVDAQLNAFLNQLPVESPIVGEVELRLGKLWLARNEEFMRAVELRGQIEKRQDAENAIVEAIKHLEVSARTPDLEMTSRYLLAICDQRLGKMHDAAARFGEVRRALVDSVHAVPAGLGEAESIYASGDIETAFKRFLHVIENAVVLDYTSTDWLSDREFESRLVEAQHAFQREGRYDLALELAKRMWPPIARDVAMQLQAETFSAWADHLIDNGKDIYGNVEPTVGQEARRLYREAGSAYFKLSKLRLSSPNYLDFIWASAESFFLGRDYGKAVELYQMYLDEPPEVREARSYLRIGESMMALGRLDDALDALNRCITFYPNDSDSYRARLIASQVLLIRNETSLAKELLRFNIEESNLTPESTVWRDSLFALGNTIYDEAIALEIESRELGVDSTDPQRMQDGLEKLELAFNLFQETSRWLNEAVQRYHDEPEAVEARYLLAESHRQSAKFPQHRLKTVSIAGTQTRLEQQVQQELVAAYELFDDLEADLIKLQDVRPLTNIEQGISRNCSFGKADVLFDQGEYQLAIEAYQSISNRYHNRPESLEAFCRIASCYRRLNRHGEARGVLEQAKLFLQDRIPVDADFEATTRYSRDQWVNVLDWLSSL